MKYLSTLVLLALISWSWTAVNAPASVPLVTHVGLQDNLKELIKTKIHEMLPKAKDIVFKQMETRTLSDSQVQANFTYSYREDSTSQEPGARTTLSGHAILNQRITNSDQPNAESDYSWSFDKLEMNGQVIDFDDSESGQPAATK